MTLSSASQDFKGKSDMSSKAASKAPPEEKASRMRLTWGYGVGVIQGKDITSALNVGSTELPAFNEDTFHLSKAPRTCLGQTKSLGNR